MSGFIVALSIGIAIGIAVSVLAAIGIGAVWLLLLSDERGDGKNKSKVSAAKLQRRQARKAAKHKRRARGGRHLRAADPIPSQAPAPVHIHTRGPMQGQRSRVDTSAMPDKLAQVFDGPPPPTRVPLHALAEDNVRTLTDTAPATASVSQLNDERRKRRRGPLSEAKLREIADSNRAAIDIYDPTAS